MPVFYIYFLPWILWLTVLRFQLFHSICLSFCSCDSNSVLICWFAPPMHLKIDSISRYLSIQYCVNSYLSVLLYVVYLNAKRKQMIGHGFAFRSRDIMRCLCIIGWHLLDKYPVFSHSLWGINYECEYIKVSK